MNKAHWTPPDGAFVGVGKPKAFSCMENTSSRNAYWCSWVEKADGAGWNVVWWFGRIGTSGKKGYRVFPGEIAAHGWMNAKRSEKLANDYVTVAHEAYTLTTSTPKKEPAQYAAAKVPKQEQVVSAPIVTVEPAKPIADEYDPLEALLS